MQKNKLIALVICSFNSNTRLRHLDQLELTEPYGNFPKITGSKQLICSFLQIPNREVRHTGKILSCSVVEISAAASFIEPVDLSRSTVGKKRHDTINSTAVNDPERSNRLYEVLSNHRERK